MIAGGAFVAGVVAGEGVGAGVCGHAVAESIAANRIKSVRKNFMASTYQPLNQVLVAIHSLRTGVSEVRSFNTLLPPARISSSTVR